MILEGGCIYSFKPSQPLSPWFSCWLPCHVLIHRKEQSSPLSPPHEDCSVQSGSTKAFLWRPFSPTHKELSRAMVASLGNPVLLSLNLPTLLCPSPLCHVSHHGSGPACCDFLCVCICLFAEMWLEGSIWWVERKGIHFPICTSDTAKAFGIDMD